MKKKLFVCSDIHSYYDIFIDALNKSGYDKNNPDHWLISLGDSFDRGEQSNEVYKFWCDRNDRTVLIKGNHEDLILECIERGFFENHDISNGTVRTIMDLGNQSKHYKGMFPDDREAYEEACDIAYAKLNSFIRHDMINYFETKNYIFVHSWIPTQFVIDQEEIALLGYMAYADPPREYISTWREAWGDEWEDARWNNPFKMAQKGFNQTGKTIVFGHWHTSWYHATHGKGSEWDNDACFDIAYDKDNHVIGIDACTAYSNKCNILVLEDELLTTE